MSKDQLYETTQRVTGLFETTNVLYENVKTFYNLDEKYIWEEAVRSKAQFQLVILFEIAHIKRPAVRKHAARHRPVRNTNILYENVQTFTNLRQKVQGKRAFVRKQNFNVKIYSKA